MTLENDVFQNTLNISTNATNTNLLATSVNTNTIDTNLLNTKTQNIISIPLETTLNGKLFINDIRINGEIQQKALTDEKHLQIETNKNNITSLQTGAMSALEREKLIHLNIYSATEFYVYSNANRNMILHTENGSIHLYSNVVYFGNQNANNRFILNGEEQSRAYTEVDYNLLQNINQQLIDNNNNINLFKELTNVNWGIIDRINPFLLSTANYNGTFFFNVLEHPALSAYVTNGLWSAGSMRIMISYSINFGSKNALLKKFISQIRTYNVNTNTVIKNSLNQGISYFFHQNFHDYINYNDSIVIDIENFVEIKLRTQWELNSSAALSSLNCEISIQQV